MKTSGKMLMTGGLLLCGLGLPRISYGISGCSNSTLVGIYNAQVSTISFGSVLPTFNSTTGTGTSGTGATGTGATGTGTTGTGTGTGTGTTGSGGTGATGTGTSGTGTGSAGTGTSTTPLVPPALTGGLSSTLTSLAGNMAGLGRFLFDGSGNIVGTSVSTSGVVTTGNALLGTYTVNSDCTLTMKLNSGQTFDGVIVSSGSGISGLANPNGILNEVLFVETDSTGAGVSGTLVRSPNSCVNAGSPQSFGFLFSGVTPAVASTSTGTGTGTGSTGTGATGTGSSGTGATGTGATGSGSTGTGATGTGSTGTGATGTGTGTGTTGTGSTSVAAGTEVPNVGVGVLQTDGAGGFTLKETSAANGSIERFTASGTYTIGSNCALSLTFTPGTSTLNGAPDSTFTPAVNFSGLLGTTSGVLSVQPSKGVALTGTFTPQ